MACEPHRARYRGGNGLGKAVAARFLGNGDTVFITGRNAGRLADTAAEIGAKPIAGDATNPAQVARIAGDIGDDLDVLVNMAGGNTDFTAAAAGPGGPVAELERVAAAWHANLDANLLSAVLTTTAVLGKLRAGGSIVNVGSIGAEYASTSYGAAKAALAAWTAGLFGRGRRPGADRQRHLAGLHRRDRLLPRQAHRGADGHADQGHP